MIKIVGKVKNLGFKKVVNLCDDLIYQRQLIIEDLKVADYPEEYLITLEDEDADLDWHEGDLIVSELEFQVCQNENDFKQQIRAVCPQRISAEDA